jgi:hypothetical protein
MLFSTIATLSVLTAFNSPLLLPVSAPPVPEKEGLELSVQDFQIRKTPNQQKQRSKRFGNVKGVIKQKLML